MSSKTREAVFQFIAISELNFDYDYQRPPDKELIERIEKDWDEEACAVITVNQRADGSYWVIDGQQRTLGTRGYKGPTFEMKCDVRTGLTPKREVDLFDRLNAWRKNIPTAIRMRDRYLAGRPDTVSIIAALDELDISWSFNGSHGKGLCCLNTLHRINKRHGHEHVRTVLQFLKDTWKGDDLAYGASFVEAVSTFLKRYGSHAPLAELSRRLGRIHPETVLRSGYDAFRAGRIALQTALVRELVDAHDYKLQRNRIRSRDD